MSKRPLCRLFFIFVLMSALCKVNPSFAQFNNNTDPFGKPIVLDTSALNDNDTIINKNGFFSLFKGKPGKAALFGLLIPSGGQIYNKKWWKVPLALGIDGSLTYVLVFNRQQYNKSEKKYLELLNEGSPLASRYKQQRDYYRKWSEYSWLWLIGGHLITVVDAFVDRHLMDFDISPDLSIVPDFTPTHGGYFVINAGIRLNITSKINASPNPNIIHIYP